MANLERVKKIAKILSDGKFHTRNELLKAYYHFADSLYEIRKRGGIVKKQYDTHLHQYIYRSINIPEIVSLQKRKKESFMQKFLSFIKF